MKWKHASRRGMTLTAAMASEDGRLWFPPYYRARARAFTAEDLNAARALRMQGQKDAARIRLAAARTDRIFITAWAPPLAA